MSCCNKNSCDPCKKGCIPAKYDCGFDIFANPYDKSVWNVMLNGMVHRVKIPDIYEHDTKLSASFNKRALVFDAEKHQDIITGSQLSGLINLNELRDVDIDDLDNCDFLMWNPGCSVCGDGCTPKSAAWRKWHIPDAGDNIAEIDEDGYYHVLGKNDCGCPIEQKVPIVPSGMTEINYVRDSVPEDPDFPWYYGQYNDTINLYLSQNASQYFGKYALKVTVNYGIQSAKSDACQNVNFRSILVPVVVGESVNITREASILQGYSIAASTPEIPWGTQSLRGSFVFIVPKGKEAYLHHEFRLHSISSFSATDHYLANPTYDGKRVPDNIASQVNAFEWNASRLNALQVIVEPTMGASNFDPVVDEERSQLDAAVDEYPAL